jgi:D-glycero-alpha-D-manno-heptose-7-phosphate kinase
MIISRSPLRITLGGGGTDVPSYYKKHGGFLITGAINKYIFVGANRQFYDNISLKYSKIEVVEDLHSINHNLFREALKLLGINCGIEVTSLADIPSGTGLGSSGAFLVALLNTLHHYGGGEVEKRHLAEEACKIEMDILREHEGKQDPYASAFGGIRVFEISKNGFVNVTPIANEDLIKSTLQENLFLFFTGEKRKSTASEVIKKQNENKNVEEKMHEIKKIGQMTKKAFENQDFDAFGKFLNEHWKIKKKYAPHATNDFIDTCYERAIDSGCLGGKIMGAGGGGGFFMFYHPGPVTAHWEFVEKMKRNNLHHMSFKFDNNGVMVVSKEEF